MSTRAELSVFLKRNGNKVDETMTMDQLYEKAEYIRKRRKESYDRTRQKKKQRLEQLENDNMILKTQNQLLEDLLDKREPAFQTFPSSENDDLFKDFLAFVFP